METVREVTMKLHIKTNKRTLEKEFNNLYDLRIFMDGFFSGVADRRSPNSKSKYMGPERRGQVQRILS
jgi:hypothetical protein